LKPNDFYKNQVNKYGYLWSGDFKSWEEAQKESIGYNAENILENVKSSTLKAKDKINIYERDSWIISGEPTYAFELLNWIKKSSINNNINLIDFGGSLGTTYFQLKRYLKEYNIRWNIIEQDNFVETGKKLIEDDNIKFYKTIDECLSVTNPNCFISSSALPYIKNPFDILEKVFLSEQFEFILLDRISVINGDNDRITIQIVPADIYEAIYPCWFFSEDKLLKTFMNNRYNHIKTFEALGGNNFAPKIKTSSYKGYIFRKI